MKSLMLRLPDDAVKVIQYKNSIDVMNVLETLTGLTRSDKAFYFSLLYNGVERAFKRGKLMFEITELLDEEINVS